MSVPRRFLLFSYVVYCKTRAVGQQKNNFKEPLLLLRAEKSSTWYCERNNTFALSSSRSLDKNRVRNTKKRKIAMQQVAERAIIRHLNVADVCIASTASRVLLDSSLLFVISEASWHTIPSFAAGIQSWCSFIMLCYRTCAEKVVGNWRIKTVWKWALVVVKFSQKRY